MLPAWARLQRPDRERGVRIATTPLIADPDELEWRVVERAPAALLPHRPGRPAGHPGPHRPDRGRLRRARRRDRARARALPDPRAAARVAGRAGPARPGGPPGAAAGGPPAPPPRRHPPPRPHSPRP